jgi:hypothetical protein
VQLDWGYDDMESCFTSPLNNELRVRWLNDSTRIMHLSEARLINEHAVWMLRSHGYDLDGLRATFWWNEFQGMHLATSICRDLGDEYRFEPEEIPCYGLIRRVLPRYAIDKPPGDLVA